MTRHITPHKGGRTKRVHFTLTSAELEALDKACGNLSRSDWVMEQVNRVTNGAESEFEQASEIWMEEYREEIQARVRRMASDSYREFNDGHEGS